MRGSALPYLTSGCVLGDVALSDEQDKAFAGADQPVVRLAAGSTLPLVCAR